MRVENLREAQKMWADAKRENTLEGTLLETNVGTTKGVS